MSAPLDELKELPTLDGLSEAQLQMLAAISECVDFPSGTTIFREGGPATDVYFIVSGAVALEICAASVGCRRILTMGPGELLGWSPVLEQPHLTATARTLSATRAVKISARQILSLCESDLRFGYEFMKRAALALAKRLSATRMQLLNVYGEAMPLSVAEKAHG